MKVTLAFLLLLAAAVAAGEGRTAIVGTWAMKTDYQGREIPAQLVIALDKEGNLTGTWKSMGRDVPLRNIAFIDGTLTFERAMGQGRTMTFKATLEKDRLVGAHDGPMGELECTGQRISEADLKDPEKEFDLHSMRAAPRDAFEVLDHPEMVAAAASKLADDQPVIGVEIDGEAKAYPVRVMGSHELVNDHCGREPIAVSW